MSFSIEAIKNFKRELKMLAKKYPSIKEDIARLGASLSENPFQGVAIGNDCYKIRLAIKSKGEGKSGGSRVITNVLVDASTVYLLSIYDKSEVDNLSDKELKALLKLAAEQPAPDSDSNSAAESSAL